MGRDAVIYFVSEKENPEFPWGSLIGATYKKIEPPYDATEATHRIELTGNDRYYGKDYERGVWPTIAGILMDLFASKDIQKVFYGSDGEDYVQEITPKYVAAMSLYYMKHGNRPYRGK